MLLRYDPSDLSSGHGTQLKDCRVNDALFTDESVKVIHEATQGAARAIGGLACSCLLHAMSANARLVDDHSVKLVLENEYR